MAYGRMYRRRRRRSAWKRRARSQVFDRIGQSSSKVNQKIVTFSQPAAEPLQTRDLFSTPLTDITYNSTNVRTERENNVINLTGFHLQMELANIQDVPICVRMAIIHPRSELSNSLNVINTNFFRGYGTSRGENFIASNSGPISLTYMNNPINPDEHTILWSYKCLLPNAVIEDTAVEGTYPDAFEGRFKKSYKTINKFIPLRRQIRYENSSLSTPSDGHLFLVVWVERFLELENSARVKALRYQCRVHRYFREGRR